MYHVVIQVKRNRPRRLSYGARMTTDLYVLAAAIVLTWVMVVSAGVIRTRGWSPAGMKVVFGNRADLPAPQGFAGRALRAANNMVENLPLFIGAIAVVHLGGKSGDRTVIGAHIFFWSRLVYWPVYLAGVPYLRTLAWYASIMGIGVILSAIL